jgi:hypothetical protein
MAPEVAPAKDLPGRTCDVRRGTQATDRPLQQPLQTGAVLER